MVDTESIFFFLIDHDSIDLVDSEKKKIVTPLPSRWYGRIIIYYGERFLNNKSPNFFLGNFVMKLNGPFELGKRM